MSIGKPFLPGRLKTGGRIKGSRNKISEAFLKDLAAEWEQSGPAALKVMVHEEPGNFVKVVAALLPKEFEITDSRLTELSDEEIDGLIAQLRGKIRSGLVTGAGSRAITTTH